MSRAKDLINSKYIGEAEQEELKLMPPDTIVFGYEDYMKWSKILYGNIETIKLNDNSEKYKLELVNNAHDKIFRKLLDEKQNAIEVINKTIEFNQILSEKYIEKYDSSYINEELKNSECDVVYRRTDKNVIYLVEHQTAIDYTMAYRMLEYKLLIIRSIVNNEIEKINNQKYKYPLVIPVVLYTGRYKWNAKLTFEEMQDESEYYGDSKKRGFTEYNVLDINVMSEEELLKNKTLITKFMLIEKAKNKEDFFENLNKIIKIFRTNKNIYSNDQIKFFKKAVLAIPMGTRYKEEIKKIFNKEKEEHGMLQIVQTLREEEERERIEDERRQRELKEIREGKKEIREGKKEIREGKKEIREGKKEIREGKKEIREGKRIIIRNMIVEKIPIKVICRVTGMSKEEIEKLI